MLLREGAWPRDPAAVLQAMLDAGTRDPRELAEAARRAIIPDLLRRRALQRLEPLIFDPEFERMLCHGGDSAGVLAPSEALALRDRIESYVGSVPRERAALVCTGPIRPLVAEIVHRSGIRLDVFAYAELPEELPVVPAQVIQAIR
jgi:flagellar biosynthesis component FlhA